MSLRALAAVALILTSMIPRAAQAIDATWTAGAVGNWSDATLWSTNPLFPNTADYNVEFASGAPFLDEDYTIGGMTWTGGAVAGPADYFFGRALTVTGPATLSGPNDKRITNSRIDFRGDTVWSGGDIRLDAALDALHRAQLDINGLFDIQFDGRLISDPGLASVLWMYDRMTKSGGDGTAEIEPYVYNGGTVHVESGQLHFQGGGQFGGNLLVDEGAVLHFSDPDPTEVGAFGTRSRLNANGKIVSAGLVRFGHAEGLISIPEILGAIDAPVLELDPGDTGYAFVLKSATIGATTPGTFSILSGGVGFHGATARVTEVSVADANLFVSDDGHLFVQGDMSVAEGGLVQLGDINTRGSITFDGDVPQHISGPAEVRVYRDSVLEAEHSLVIDSGITIRGGGHIRGGAEGGVLHGEINASYDTLYGGWMEISEMTIASGGVAETGPAGRLKMVSAWHNNGLLRVSSGCTLELGGTFGVGDIGVIERAAGSIVEMSGTLQNVGTTLDLETTTGTLQSLGGTIVGGRIESSGASQLVTRFSGTKLIGVTLAADVSAISGGALAVENGLTLDQATIATSIGVWPGSQTIGGVGEITGSLGGGNSVEDEVTISPGITVRGGIDGGASPSRRIFFNRGTVQHGAANQSLTLRRVVNDGGLIHAAASKTINLSMISSGLTEFVQTAGEIRVDISGRVIVQAGALAIRGGTLSGGGTVAVSAANNPDPFVRVTGGGAITPGASIGTLSIDGNLAIGDGGRLAVEIAGAASDQLRVIKSFTQTLPGNIDLASANDYLEVSLLEPATAPWYIIATYAGTLTGKFDHVTPGYSVAYDTVQKRVYLNAAKRADFDYDGDVDGRDMLIWQRNAGMTAGASRLQGDANDDGAVDAADLALWQTQFGTLATAAAAAIPEPCGAALFLLGIVGLISRRAARRSAPGSARGLPHSTRGVLQPPARGPG